MVAHERRLRAGPTNDACDDECPHDEAGVLWAEAASTFGAEAAELAFLRSHGRRRSNR
jgi:predicted outer membrane protein